MERTIRLEGDELQRVLGAAMLLAEREPYFESCVVAAYRKLEGKPVPTVTGEPGDENVVRTGPNELWGVHVDGEAVVLIRQTES